ncbi:hypothetical protein BS78_03G024400 [Paspalum vaginatum]|nr:hypothetical protein BS78_03G024400 [Paspalum vaginatum]
MQQQTSWQYPNKKCCGDRGRAAAREEVRRHSRSAPPGKRVQELTPRERRVMEVNLFIWLAIPDAEAYIAMTENKVEEEYRWAGKLHRYDLDKEWWHLKS